MYDAGYSTLYLFTHTGCIGHKKNFTAVSADTINFVPETKLLKRTAVIIFA